MLKCIGRSKNPKSEGFTSPYSSSGVTIMEQMAINFNSPLLPEKIMTNILKRLPVKSLIRFQSVCKHWKNLIKTPSFIQDHLHHSRHYNPSFLFFQVCGIDSLHLRLVDCEMQVRDVHKPPPLDSLPFDLVRIIGSSNGLLCVTINDSKDDLYPSSLLLWNFATRDIREVPRSRSIISGVYICLFGFSPFVNDYKIVAIYTSMDDGMVCGAEVYSFSRDSWKEIEFGDLVGIVLSDRTVVSSNGTIFWFGDGEVEEGVIRVLVSFDIASEVFTVISVFPDGLGANLTLYEDKPALLNSGLGGSPKFDLWVMEEDIGSSRQRWSWTRILTGPCPWAFSYGTVWRDNIVMPGVEIECEIGKTNEPPKCGICLFNVTTSEFKMLFIPDFLPCNFLDYVESLVPVVNIHNIEEPRF